MPYFLAFLSNLSLLFTRRRFASKVHNRGQFNQTTIDACAFYLNIRLVETSAFFISKPLIHSQHGVLRSEQVKCFPDVPCPLPIYNTR